MVAVGVLDERLGAPEGGTQAGAHPMAAGTPLIRDQRLVTRHAILFFFL